VSVALSPASAAVGCRQKARQAICEASAAEDAAVAVSAVCDPRHARVPGVRVCHRPLHNAPCIPHHTFQTHTLNVLFVVTHWCIDPLGTREHEARFVPCSSPPFVCARACGNPLCVYILGAVCVCVCTVCFRCRPLTQWSVCVVVARGYGYVLF